MLEALELVSVLLDLLTVLLSLLDAQLRQLELAEAPNLALQVVLVLHLQLLLKLGHPVLECLEGHEPLGLTGIPHLGLNPLELLLKVHGCLARLLGLHVA